MDITLHCLEKGAGAPLVLLHGNGEDLTYFNNQTDAFSAAYRVIAVDTRGHGGSPRGDAPFTICQFAEDLKAFLDARGIARAHLLGFSDGGNIALQFALTYPERVDRLILNGANLDPSGLKPSVLLSVTLAYRLTRLLAGRSATARRRMELLALMADEPQIPFAALHALRTPTLVLVGTRDLIRDSHSRRIAESLPDAQLVRIAGGHGIAKEQPAAFNAAVLRFLEG